MMSFSKIYTLWSNSERILRLKEYKGFADDISFKFHVELFFHSSICLVFRMFVFLYFFPSILRQFTLEEVLVLRCGLWGHWT
jgi:hypothetical protein